MFPDLLSLIVAAGSSANVSLYPLLHSLYVSLLRSDVLDEHTTLTGLRENVTLLLLLFGRFNSLRIFSLLADDDDGPEVKRTRTDSPAAGYSGTPPGPMMPGHMQRPQYGPPG